MRPHQMGTDDEVGFIIDQDLVAVDRLCLLARREPSGSSRGLHAQLDALFPCRGFAEAEGRNCGMVKATLGTPS